MISSDPNGLLWLAAVLIILMAGCLAAAEE
jgi:hypothetical protein